MSQPFSPAEIETARNVPFKIVLEHLGAYGKQDKEYQPLDPERRSMRIQPMGIRLLPKSMKKKQARNTPIHSALRSNK